MRFRYPAEKFAQARESLLLPKVDEARRFAGAIDEARRAVRKVPLDDLRPQTREWLGTVQQILHMTDGLPWREAFDIVDAARRQAFASAIENLAIAFGAAFQGERDLP